VLAAGIDVLVHGAASASLLVLDVRQEELHLRVYLGDQALALAADLAALGLDGVLQGETRRGVRLTLTWIVSELS